MALFHSIYVVNKHLTTPQSSGDLPLTYPSEFWARNPGKPPIILHTLNDEQSYHLVNTMLNDNTWNDVVVASFMAKVITENPAIFQVNSPVAWTIGTINIATAGANVNPLSLLHTTRPAEVYQAIDQPAASDRATRLSLFFALLLVYRKSLTKSNIETYGQESDRMDQFFRNTKFGLREQESNRIAIHIGNEKLTANYLKIISAIDMFFFHFPNAEYSSMRKATRPSRYRDCRVITSLGQICKVTGLTMTDLALFLYTEALARDLIRVGRKEQGAEDVNGYFPYQVDMGIVERSPYSMNRNQTLWLWLHTIGALMGETTSINAVMPSYPSNIFKTINTACAFVLFLQKQNVRQISQSEATMRVYQQHQEEGRIAAPLPVPGGEEGVPDKAEGEGGAAGVAQPAAMPQQAVIPSLSYSKMKLIELYMKFLQDPIPGETPAGMKSNELLVKILQFGLTDDDRKTLGLIASTFRNPNANSVGAYLKRYFPLIPNA